LNNAWLLARVLYYSRLDDFELIYEANGGLRGAVATIIETGSRMPPWAAVDSLLAYPDATGAEAEVGQ
jgi:hypothetical protein